MGDHSDGMSHGSTEFVEPCEMLHTEYAKQLTLLQEKYGAHPSFRQRRRLNAERRALRRRLVAQRNGRTVWW